MRNLKKMVLSENTKVAISLTTAITLLLSIITFTSFMVSFSKDIEKGIEINTISIEDNSSDIDEIHATDKEQNDKIQAIELTEMEIRTKLVSIESRLLEVLTILKDK